MSDQSFQDMLEAQWAQGKFVCVGLDSDFSKIPESAYRSGNETDVSVENTIVAFNKAIVEATKDIVCAYKPNIAFYEKYGDEGLGALNRSIWHIKSSAPDVPVILDAKRADIGNTNEGYVDAAFSYLHADAITVHPYLGGEALQPFLGQRNKGIIVLCRTSNSGAGEFQDLMVSPTEEDAAKWGLTYQMPIGDFGTQDLMPLYQYVAHRVAKEWNGNNNCMLVVGATYPKELQKVREIIGDIPILIPAVGAQGGDVKKAVSAGKDSRGQGMIINSSRAIIFASKEADFADAARRETEKLHNTIKQALQEK